MCKWFFFDQQLILMIEFIFEFCWGVWSENDLIKTFYNLPIRLCFVDALVYSDVRVNEFHNHCDVLIIYLLNHFGHQC